MGVINMAHGELIMLGAYTTYVIQLLMPDQIGLSLFVAIPAAFLVSALVGIAIERGVIRFLYGRPLETLLATFGVSLILQQLVRTVVSPLNRTVITPDWMSGSLMINEALSLTLNRLYVIGFALVVFAGLMLIMRKTRLGLDVRAVTQNRAMARSLGIRATRVDILTFRPGFWRCRPGGCGAFAAHQRGPQPGPGLHHRFLHGGGVRRRRKPLGHLTGRPVAGHHQPAAGTLGWCGPRQDPGAGSDHPVHSKTATRALPAKRPSCRGLILCG